MRYALVAEIDELHTYVNEKKNKKWLWTVVNHFKPGIITWVLGDRSAETFKPGHYKMLAMLFIRH